MAERSKSTSRADNRTIAMYVLWTWLRRIESLGQTLLPQMFLHGMQSFTAVEQFTTWKDVTGKKLTSAVA